MRMVAIGCVLALLSPRIADAMDIADLLSAPIPDAPVAASDAPVFAWVGKQYGVRNVYVAQAPAFEPRKLTAYSEDDGQPISGLQLSADGRRLAYVRGDREATNPTSDPDGVEQAVWIVSTDSASVAQRIGTGSAAMFSPQGDALLVQGREGVACHAVPAGATAPKWCAASMFKLKGVNRAEAFSPDGSKLAFTSVRNDHAFVGVLDLAARSVRWMAPDVAFDGHPVWSPDSRRLAFLRSEARTRIDGAQVFEVWVGDTTSGQASRVYRSHASAGGFAQNFRANPLRWSNAGHLLFLSESDGWLRWYKLPTVADGASPVALTEGSCEIEDTASSSTTDVIFSANCDDLERRQLFVYDHGSSTTKRLTATDAIATQPQIAGNGEWIAFLHADARQPTAVAVMPRKGGQVRRIYPARLPDAFPLDELATPKTVRFRAADGVDVHAQLLQPRGVAAGKRPALIYVHGGPIRQMLPGWMPMDYYYHDYANQQWLASQGYVVLAVNFRAGTGYGQAFRRAERQGPRGASEYQDVLAAQAYLASRPDVDAGRIGIYGGSYGGYLTALALARNSDLFAVGVDRHGVHDWREAAKGLDATAGWALKADELDTAWKSSPLERVASWRSPVLVIHGDDDPAVLFAQSAHLVAALRQRGVPVQTLVVPGEHHFFLRHATWLDVHRRSAEFLNQHLKP